MSQATFSNTLTILELLRGQCEARMCVCLCASRCFRRCKSPSLCVQPNRDFHSFGRKLRSTLTGESHDFGSCRHLHLNFQAFKRLQDVRLCCLCVSSAERDGLAPSLTRASENTTWQRGSLRERQRGRDPRSNSIIEMVSHLNIEIVPTFWEPSSSIYLSCSLFPSLSPAPFSPPGFSKENWQTWSAGWGRQKSI